MKSSLKKNAFTAHINSKQGQKFIELMKKYCRESGNLNYLHQGDEIAFFDKDKDGIERAIERLKK